MNMLNQNSLTPVPPGMPSFQSQMANFTQGLQNVRGDMNMPMSMPGNPPVNPANQGVSLHVGNLGQEVNEQRLYEHFIQYGHILSTKVMRDSYNGESRGFGFVTFANINDALRAKSLLNYTTILDREIRISLKRNPSELNQNANLFFKNLDPAISSKKLEEECSKYGSIISCIVRMDDDNGKSLGYGYVQFESAQNAEECVNAMNNMKLGEKTVSVSVFLPKNQRKNPFSKSNLYLKNFPSTWNTEQVEQFILKTFGIYGQITSNGVFEDKNIHRIYAFVAFDDQEAAQKALNELNDFEFDGEEEKLYVGFAQNKATRKRTLKSKHLKFKNETNLYIKSLKSDTTEKMVKDAFERYGKVTSVCVMSHKPKNPATNEVDNSVNLKFGFINMSSGEEAKHAFTECKKDPIVLNLIDQSLLNRSPEFIYFAQNKTVRQQYLRMQRKNLKTSKMIQDNVLQYYQLMKYMMPDQFKGNQRGGRGGFQKNMRGNNNNRGNFNNRGGRGGYNQQNNFQNRNANSQFQGQTPAPQGGMNNMQQGNNMFGNNFPQMMMNMNNMPGSLQALQQQMMGQQGMQGQGIPSMTPAPQMNENVMQSMPKNMNQMSNQKSVVKDLNWLSQNIDAFEMMEHHEKKNILGNLMYPLVERNCPIKENVPKITGMLIDLEVLKPKEIVEIMENEEALIERIEEATGIINETE